MNTPDTQTPIAAPQIAEVRSHLMAFLAALRDPANAMTPDRARAGAQVACVLVDTAKVEIEYLRLSHQEHSDFLEPPPAAIPDSGYSQGAIARLPGVTKHRMKG